MQQGVSRPSGCKAGGRTGGIKKQHGPAQVIASDSTALWSRRAKTNWCRESSSVRWAGTAAQVSSPKMGLNRLLRVHFTICRFHGQNASELEDAALVNPWRQGRIYRSKMAGLEMTRQGQSPSRRFRSTGSLPVCRPSGHYQEPLQRLACNTAVSSTQLNVRPRCPVHHSRFRYVFRERSP